MILKCNHYQYQRKPTTSFADADSNFGSDVIFSDIVHVLNYFNAGFCFHIWSVSWRGVV